MKKPLTRCATGGSSASTAARDTGCASWGNHNSSAACSVVRRQLSSGAGGAVDYSSLMAGPGTVLHNDIMESAARKQTG